MINPGGLVLPQPVLPNLQFIQSTGRQCIGVDWRVKGNGNAASAAWPTTRRVVYVPMVLDAPFTVVRGWLVNGTAVSGNFDIGIYTDVDGAPVTKIASTGSTGQSGTSVIQAAAITSLTLAPGRYFIALMVDNTTATVYRQTGPLGLWQLKALGMMNETPGAGSTLPSTATPITVQASHLPVFGIASTTLV